MNLDFSPMLTNQSLNEGKERDCAARTKGNSETGGGKAGPNQEATMSRSSKKALDNGHSHNTNSSIGPAYAH